jgi:hypothetical protein
LTADLDRLVAFYERVFDAGTTLDIVEEGVRHVFPQVGPTTVLHPFQIIRWARAAARPRDDVPARAPRPLCSAGPSAEAFAEIRRRLVVEAALDGAVRDMRTTWILGFHDRDGFYVE